MARTPAPRATKKLPPKPEVTATLLKAKLGPKDALTDRTVVLYDPATGRMEGAHRVITLSGGTESTDPAGPAEALEIPPTARGRLATLRHDGAIAEDKDIAVQVSGGKARLALVKRTAPAKTASRQKGVRAPGP